MNNVVKVVKKKKKELISILISLIISIIVLKKWGIIAFILVVFILLICFVPSLRKKLIIFINNFISMIQKKKKGKHQQNNMGKHAKTNSKALEKKNIKEKKIDKDKKIPLKKEKPKKKKKKILKIILILFLSGIILTILAIVGFCFYIVSQAPSFDPKELYVTEPSIVYDKDGNEIAKLGSEQRVILEYKDLPEVLIDAIVATEDSKFFSHNGVDWARFMKASVMQLLGNSQAGGASTLTMQVSKNTYTSAEASGIKGIIRKFTDVYISEFKIEPNYTKEEILEFYVNSYYLGNNAYGVEQASLTYFGKSAKDLNISEAAMIAGLFQAPSTYNPYTNPKRTEQRRKLVLKYMKRHGYINEKEFKIANKLTVEKIVKEKNSALNEEGVEINEYQSFLDVVTAEVEEDTSNNPYTTPMKIYTTLDTEKQKYINDIMNGVSYDWENEEVQAGIAVVDVKTGALVAVGGGRNINAVATLNHATQVKRQIGSTAKPLYDYGPAIEFLNWSSGTPDVDEPISYSNGTTINNWNGQFEGYETIRTALSRSRNIPALKAFQANNKSDIKNFVTSLGLSPEEGLHEAHSIGGYTGESPQSMANAYAAFSNGGTYNSRHSYTKIEYMAEDKTVEKKIETNQVMKDSTAYIISDMLTTTAEYAMGRYYNINGMRYAAKTGTSNFDAKTLADRGLTYKNAVNDLWVVGFNTEYSIGVWYGYDDNKSKYYNLLSSGQHERLFQAVGKGMFTNKSSFTKPASVSEVTIETECPTPMLPSEYTPDDLKKTELFVKGSEPTETSPRFSKLSNVSGLKASNSNGKVTLSWDAASVPEINTQSFLTNYFKDTFRNSGYLNSFIEARMGYINNTMGAFGYQIYKKSGNDLVSLGFTTDTSFSTNVQNGSYTFIVKTAYANFGQTASDGSSVNINVSGSDENKEKDEHKEKESDKEKEKDKEPETDKSIDPSCSSYGDEASLENGKCIDNENNVIGDACPIGYHYTNSKCMPN